MNPHLTTFIAGLDERFPDDSTTMSMSEWIGSNTKLRQRPFSFKGFEFQRQIVDDMHPDLTCMKLSQIGLTEVQMRKFFGFLKRNVGTSGIFSMPTLPMRDRLSQTRIKTLIDGESIFNGPMVAKPVRHKGLYQVDESFGYITGTTEGEATSISADILMEDEVDLADQSMRSLFQSRLQGSLWKITQRFSTPTYLGYGIDAAYQASDKHEWFIRCACGHHQVPIFHPRFLCLPGLRGDHEDLSKLSQEQVDAIDMDGTYVRCEKCSRPLDLGAPGREWIPEFPSRRARGYRVRPFSITTITIPYIFRMLLEYQRKDNLKGWHNTVIGEAFNDSNARISEEDLIAIMTPRQVEAGELGSGDLFLGCDVGQTCHVVIGKPNALLEFHQVPQHDIVEFVKGRVETLGIIQGGIDMYPYTPTAEAIRDVTNGVIMPMAYSTSKVAPAVKEQVDEFEVITHYTINRTQALDLVAKQCRLRTWQLAGYGPFASLVKTHFRDMIRIEAPDEPPVWNKINGDDHFLHAAALQQTAVRLRAGIEFSTDQRSSVFLGGGSRLFQPVGRPIFRGADHAGVLR
ncbi:MULTISPECIES: phage terminase large subunit family protein [Methylobacterium]|uniref:Bacteriophage tail assembly protein n=6 Tax=Pseudomonadota TaxID=1224 RepID=A0ABQ4T259_9HYPH|nr:MULTISPECIES: phage terminase large subunit family protein [Methylobacterium]PIU05661.1 MAG: hypothetical protein COT56_13535 [Methylobacterium sp. CG09_land_8_20_14_0_10_71_15]PIU12371.1 MAG: hypothetical protein COT28_15380 [Methylobacterium sp. CG08_land_8_20_14_0_20_71_15]GBU16883.1 hypothetical protein AwMethylo_10980 [Methylobacterium sp.]GJE07971.1 hypothetical protein AOPFMNJM_3303 [Methylobacterium jeotgali]